MEKRDERTEQQQQQRPSPARYKGVRMRKWGTWVAEVRYPNSRRRLWLGSFSTAEMAALAYDAAVYCLRGPGAGAPNFPDQPPDIPNAGTLSRYEIRQAAERHAHQVAAILWPEESGCGVGGGAVKALAADEGGQGSSRGPQATPPPPPELFLEFHDPASGAGDERFWGGEGDDDGDVFGSFPLWDFSE